MSSTKNIGPGSMSEEETELTESQPAQKRRRIAARELPAEHTSNLDPNVANTPKRGARRSLPCECCIRAAILSEGDLGYCYESSWPSRKCYACVMSGHQCHPCHNALKPYARRMIMALDNDENTVLFLCSDQHVSLANLSRCMTGAVRRYASHSHFSRSPNLCSMTWGIYARLMVRQY